MEEEHRQILWRALLCIPSKHRSFKDALLAMLCVGDDADFAQDPQGDARGRGRVHPEGAGQRGIRFFLPYPARATLRLDGWTHVWMVSLMPSNIAYFSALLLVLLASSRTHAQIVNGSFEADPPTTCPPTGWTGGCKMGGSGIINIPNMPGPAFATPIGKDGDSSGGVYAGGSLRQTVAINGGVTYKLSYYAKYMTAVGMAKGVLRTRVLDDSGKVVVEQTPSLTGGGAGNVGYQKYTLDVPAIGKDAPLTIEFANLDSSNGQVSVDVVTLDRILAQTPPVLDLPKLEAGIWKLAWTETSNQQVVQKAYDPSGPWISLDSSSAQTSGGKVRLDFAVEPDAKEIYFRTFQVQ